MMKCPQCSKMMQVDARVCGFCSYDFVQRKPASSPPKTAVKGCLSIIALIVLGAIILMGIRAMVVETPPKPQTAAQ
jgi:hypothetical protein